MSDERDIGRMLAEFTCRYLQAETEAERKKLERELDRHIARPELTDDMKGIAREFEIRLKRSSSPPAELSPEYREAFAPLFGRMAAVPPPDEWEWLFCDVWTPLMVRFYFLYGVEPLREFLIRQAFWLVAPSIECFESLTADTDDIERRRKTRLLVEAVEADVKRITEMANGRFLVALGSRLASVVDDTLTEISLWALGELEGSAKTRTAEVRDHILKERMRIEKVRLETPTPGAPTLTKEVFEALLGKAQAELKPLNMDQTKAAVLAYINNNYPDVRCGSVKQLNRLLRKFGLDHRFSVENRGLNSE